MTTEPKLATYWIVVNDELAFITSDKLHAICEAERYLSHSPSAGICVREPGGDLIWRSDKQ